MQTLTLSQNSSVQTTNIRPNGWDEKLAEKYIPGTRLNTDGWSYATHFSKLNLYEAWSYCCECCDKAIRQCKNNETIFLKTAEQWQEYLKVNANSITSGGIPTEGTDIMNTTLEQTTRKSWNKTVPQDLEQAITTDYQNGISVSEISQKYTVVNTAVKEFIAENNVQRNAGITPKQRGRARTTIAVDNDVISKAMNLFRQGITVSEIAKQLNVNPVELSTQMKAHGAVIQRGKKKAL